MKECAKINVLYVVSIDNLSYVKWSQNSLCRDAVDRDKSIFFTSELIETGQSVVFKANIVRSNKISGKYQVRGESGRD